MREILVGDMSRRGSVLEGVRVVDFTIIVNGPTCTRLLADFGAEVIQIRTARRSIGRLFADGEGYWNNYNRNKLGITADLSRPQAVEVVKKLIRISDIVVDNFSPKVMRNWGFDYPNLRKLKPDIIKVTMPSMGSTGPWADYRGAGVAFQALSGLTYLTGFPGLPLSGFTAMPYGDSIGGLNGALAILAALEYRRRTGKGQWLDIAAVEACIAATDTMILDMTVNRRAAMPVGNRCRHPKGAPYGIYRCKGDDRWCAITVFTEEEWKAFCNAIGNLYWTTDPKFATQRDRMANAEELDNLVEDWTVSRTAAEVMTLLQQAGVAAGVVQVADDIAHDPQLEARQFYWTAEHPTMGMTHFDGQPMKLSRTPCVTPRASRLLGQDNDYVYGDLLGMSKEDIAKYTEQRIFA